MFSKIKKLILPVLIVCFILMSLPLNADILKTYKGTLPKPSEAEWQEMLENRQERHACKQKTAKALNDYKFAKLALNPTPTTNQIKVDMLYYEINFELNFSTETIDGFSESKIEAIYDGVDAVDFNLTDLLNVYSVELNGNNISNYNHTNDILTVYLGQQFNTGQQFTIRIEYGGTPGFDGTDGLNFYSDWGMDIAYTNCEPWGARLWWPCKDHPYDKPDSVDIIITHPSSKTLVSNGVMRSSTNNGDGTYTTHWHESYPIATYLVQIGCADYDLYTDSWEYEAGETMPIYNYSYDGVPASSGYYSTYYMRTFTKPSLEALSYYFTLYPFVDEKYGHNHYGWGGAMEHQTLTSISPYFNTEYVIAHELGHQWAGDKVTCENFHHMWLNEGFASYSEALYFKYHYGETYYKDWLNGQKRLDVGTPYVEDIVNDDMFDNATVYDKGSWVVYMLHMVLGDSLFLEATDNYFNHPLLAWGGATTDDLEMACEEVYGSDLSWFFNQWVYLPGNPNYRYSYMEEEDTENGGYDAFLLLSQTQEGAVFQMPVDMRVFAGGWDSAFTVFNSQRGQVWEIDVPNPVDSMWVDRDEKILRTVEYDPEFSMSILAGKEADTAYIGQPYYAEYSAVAGVPPYNWTKISGQFPYGLAFHNESTAYLQGEPTWASDFVFSLELTDSDTPPNADTITLSITVLEGDAPDIPQLISPSNGTTTSNTQPIFTWSSTAGAGGNYTFQIAADQQFNNIIASESGITDTTHIQQNPLPEGFLFWHVKAVNSEGHESDYQSSPFILVIDTSQPQLRGDCNGDGAINISDVVIIINYVFIGGNPPDPFIMGDPNCDDAVNVSDAVYLINYIFIGGPPPCEV
jgi:hypothetical protein